MMVNLSPEQQIIFYENMSIVPRTVNRYFSLKEYHTQEDFVQEGYIALCNAVISYDNNRGTSFNTFASKCIRNHLINYLKRKFRSTENLTDNSYEIVSKYNGDDQEQNAIVNEIMSKAEHVLTKKEMDTIKLFYFDNLKGSEIAEMNKVSRQAIYDRLNHSIKKLKELFESDMELNK